MPGLQMFKRSFYSNLGANQPLAAGTVNLGCTRGRGSSTRMFSYCKQHSKASSLCINDFITMPNQSNQSIQSGDESCVPETIQLSSIATLSSGIWFLNASTTTVNDCQILTIDSGASLYIITKTLVNKGKIINNGSILLSGGIINNSGIITNNSSITNIGTINNGDNIGCKQGTLINGPSSTFTGPQPTNNCG
jgi:hypothetical protein